MRRSGGAGPRDGSRSVVLCPDSAATSATAATAVWGDSAGTIHNDAAGVDGADIGRLLYLCTEYVGLLELCADGKQLDGAGEAVLSGVGGSAGEPSALPL